MCTRTRMSNKLKQKKMSSQIQNCLFFFFNVACLIWRDVGVDRFAEEAAGEDGMTAGECRCLGFGAGGGGA